VGLDGWLLVLSGLGVAVVLGSKAMEHLPLTGPLVALAAGVALGPYGADVVQLPSTQPLLKDVSEVVVAIALMGVALRYPFAEVAELRRPLTWLLTVGMVGMAAAVAVIASIVFDIGWRDALLLGAVLAATDPVLSFSMVTGEAAEKAIPSRLRRLLSIESGANDGLAFPLVLLGIMLVRAHPLERLATDVGVGLVVAVVLGIAIGVAGGRVLRYLDEHRDIEDSAFFVFTLVLALLTLSVVNLAGGEGVLAVFIAGLAYNRVVGENIYEQEREVEEGVNRVLVLPVFLLLGAILPWADWAQLGAPVILFTAAVLLLRRLPIIAALARPLRFGPPEVAFYGWFGPIGVAALFWVTTATEHGARDGVLWPAVTLAVAASTVAHGITGTPGRALYARAAGAGAGDRGAGNRA